VNTVSVGKCAQCGTDMIAPEWSEHVSDRHVRNFWCCEACGYRFEDTIYFSLVGGTSMPQKRESARLSALAGGDHR
jgi:C4-type Zn-finger protein